MDEPQSFDIDPWVHNEPMKWFHLKEKRVRDAVQNADQVSRANLSPGPVPPPLVTLYLKHFGSIGKPRYLLAATSKFEGGRESIFDVWPIPPGFVPSDSRPDQVLLKLCDVCGLRFRLGQWEGKFLWEQRVRLDPQTPEVRLEIVEPHGPEIVTNHFARGNLDGTVDIALAYALDVSRLRQTLKR